MRSGVLWMVVTIWSSAQALVAVDSAAEAGAVALLQKYHDEAQGLFTTSTRASWAYATNLTQHNNQLATEASLAVTKYKTGMYKEAQKFKDANLTPATKRLMKMAFPAQLSESDAVTLSELSSNMSAIYGKGTVCLGSGPQHQCKNLDPGLVEIMASSRDYEQLKEVWRLWRENVAQKIRPFYIEHIPLINRLATLNNYKDAGDMWRQKYETDTFESDMLELYQELDPLYRLVHAYIRKKLIKVYGTEVIQPRGPLPACVLGDMWGRFWTNLYPVVVPYPDQPDLDVTQEMLRQNYTVPHMFRLGEEFFTSMGLKALPDTFWNLSMLQRPEGRDVQCHATAWDFYDGQDFRIKMCTKINFEDLETIHHELGHVQYFMQYAHLPITYRDGANDGFHEAIGELMSMSMSTPDHLAKIGLLEEVPKNTETDINFLLRTALKSVTTLPFHLVNDVWRWRLFRGDYAMDAANHEFWKLKEQYLGVVAPVPRGPQDLDPPSIFHISGRYDMIRYFTRTVLQFQFLEVLCTAAGHQGPLHTCDFYGSKEAGAKLAQMLALGSSMPWQDVLGLVAGTRRMSPRPLLNYFRPLMAWLEDDNLRDGDGVGWGDSWRPLTQHFVDSGGFGCGISLPLVTLTLLLLWWRF